MRKLLISTLSLLTLGGMANAQEGFAGPVFNPTRELQAMQMVPVCASGTPVVVSGTRFACGSSGGSWGTWQARTGRTRGVWYQNANDRGMVVHIWGQGGTSAQVSPNPSTTAGVPVAAPDGDSGEWGQADFIVPPRHWYMFNISGNGSSVRALSELLLPF